MTQTTIPDDVRAILIAEGGSPDALWQVKLESPSDAASLVRFINGSNRIVNHDGATGVAFNQAAFDYLADQSDTAQWHINVCGNPAVSGAAKLWTDDWDGFGVHFRVQPVTR